MSTIPNQISSERSTAQSMDVPMGSTSQDGYEDYGDRPMLRDRGRGGLSAGDAHIPASGMKGTIATGGAARDYRSYPPSVRESERRVNPGGPGGLNTHVSYSSLSAPNPANLPSQPPPPSNIGGVSRPPPKNHPPQPPITILDTSSSTDSSQSPKRRKSMYESAQQPPGVARVPSPTTPTSAGPSNAANQSNKEAVKRTKTSRACDPCRRKKIRQAIRFCPSTLVPTHC